MLANPPPIVVFAFNRPDHLARTLQALSSCPEAAASPLKVYCDGARRESDEAGVREVREVAAAARGFASVEVIARESNLGLATSIIDGVTLQVQKHGRVIVLEDDILVSPYFLRYMHDGLALYEHDERVAAIHGYIYPVAAPLPETFFLRGADCWGWATWARAWRHFEPDGQKLLSQLKARGLEREFDLGGRYPYMKMLSNQTRGRNQSWAIRRQASVFLRDMLTLYPARSLVQNIGIDGSGTHSGAESDYEVDLSPTPVKVQAIVVQESREALEAVRDFYGRALALPKRIRRALRTRWHRWILRSAP
jgi:hypothetical protein